MCSRMAAEISRPEALGLLVLGLAQGQSLSWQQTTNPSKNPSKNCEHLWRNCARRIWGDSLTLFFFWRISLVVVGIFSNLHCSFRNLSFCSFKWCIALQDRLIFSSRIEQLKSCVTLRTPCIFLYECLRIPLYWYLNPPDLARFSFSRIKMLYYYYVYQ